MTDTEILDWLERNLISLSEPGNPQMDGARWFGQMRNEARGSGGGASRVQIRHVSIRAAVEEAAKWTRDRAIVIAGRSLGKTEIRTDYMERAVDEETKRARQP